MNVVVTLAVYNEAEVIGDLLDRIPAQYDVIVVDDGSTDGTPEICRQRGARLIRHVANLGQGAAVLTGFMCALRADYDVIVEMDGDGQHDPADLSRFVNEFETDPDLDVLVGSRILGSSYKAPFARRTFLPYVTAVINFVTGYRLTDAMSGYRALRASSLRRCASLLNEYLEPQYLASEMFIRFAKHDLKVREIPIHISDRSAGVSRKGLLRYGWGVVRTIVKTVVQA